MKPSSEKCQWCRAKDADCMVTTHVEVLETHLHPDDESEEQVRESRAAFCADCAYRHAPSLEHFPVGSVRSTTYWREVTD